MTNNSQKGFAIPLVIAIVALVVIIGGVSYFAARQQSPANEDVIKKDGAMMEKKEDEAMMEKKEDEAMMAEYTGTVLAGKSAPLLDFVKADYDAAVKSDKLVALYFVANWCPICKVELPKLYAAFNELTTDKVIGFQINYSDNETDNNEKALASQFGVAYQHTKVFLKNGQRILKSPESWSKEQHLSEINKALAQ